MKVLEPSSLIHHVLFLQQAMTTACRANSLAGRASLPVLQASGTSRPRRLTGGSTSSAYGRLAGSSTTSATLFSHLRSSSLARLPPYSNKWVL